MIWYLWENDCNFKVAAGIKFDYKEKYIMKNLKIAMCICSCTLAIALILINLFLCEMPLWISLVVGFVAIILLSV